MDNISKQADEIEALQSIYGNDWKTESRTDRKFSLLLEESGRQVTLYITLSDGYPTDSPPSIEMSAPLLNREQKDDIHQALNMVYLENIGEQVIYQWIEKVREILQSLPEVSDEKVTSPPLASINIHEYLVVPCPDITHGEVIEDRKSNFQAHVARITKSEDVDAILWNLRQDRKISAATHNILAWKCGTKYDCDDDGEKSAGGRLLKLLELVKVDNVAVIVSRWYGGIHLGSVRFRHINDAARQVLVKAQIIPR